MADTKISLLPAQTTLATNDVIPLVSTDNSETRKITAANAGIALAKIGLSVGSVAPNSPYTGQPWIDTSAATPLLKVYTGSTWAISSVQPTSIVTSPGNSAPANPTTGVMWFDTSSSPNQLKVWNGSNWTQIDPDAVNQTSSTGSAILPAGTTAQRDGSPAAGYLRYNSDLSQFEGYNGAAWGALLGGGGSVSGSDFFYTNDYPNVRPSLLLDFANSKTLDPRVSFSRASTATYVGADGLIKTAAVNEPRFDHNPATGESLGLLIEESRTNLLTYSEQFDNAAWAKTDATVTANSVAAPDGNSTADTFSASGASSYLSQSLTAAATAYTFSVYAKAGTATSLRLDFVTAAFALGASCTFNLSNGTAGSITYYGSSSGFTAAIQSFPNGWYRCSITGTATAATWIPELALINSSGNAVYVWGAQLEAGAFPTAYIPTTTATVTRSADVAQMTGSSFSSWYRQDEGTVFLRALSRAEQYLVEIPTTGGGNYHVVAINSARAQLATVNSTTQANIFSVSNSYNLNVMNSVCAAFKQNSFAVCSNGTTVSTATSGTVPTVDLLNIGRRNNGQNYSCSTFARIAFYPARLTDAQLQNLTSS